MTLVEVARAVGCSLKSASRVHVGPSREEKGVKAWYPGCSRLGYEVREQIAYGLARRESLPRLPVARDVRRRPSCAR